MTVETAVIAVLVGFLGALIGGIITLATSRGQVADQVSSAWKKFNEPLVTEVQALREKLKTYECGIELLLGQVIGVGLAPAWRPGQEVPQIQKEKAKPLARQRTGSLIQ